MSLFGLHVRVYNDDEFRALKASGFNPGTGALFTATQHAIAEMVANDDLFQAAKRAIADATNTNLSNPEKLAAAARDVIPALISFFTTGGVTVEAAKLETLATTFVQEVYSSSFSTAMPALLKEVESVFGKKAA